MTASSSPSLAAQHTATPAMRQYFDVKRQHRDAIVFFRMGDFYEMFYEDAITASRVLELTLTSRAKDGSGGAIPMCGVPHHAMDTYLARLVRKGYRVAICDQVEDPRKAKGIVKREVTRVVSPGTFTDAAYLEAREPAFLAAIAPARTGVDGWGLAFLDVSTGEFAAAEFRGAAARDAIVAELAVLRPKEILAADDADLEAFGDLAGARLTRVASWLLDPAGARDSLCQQLGVASLVGHGLEDAACATAAAGAIVSYLRDTQRSELTHVKTIALRLTQDALLVDPITLRHLNVVTGVDGGRAGSLLDAIDRTVTAMGGRLLRQWLVRPLVTLARIHDRLDAVEDFAFRTMERGKAREVLGGIHDLERLIARISLGTAGPRDLAALAQSLAELPRLLEAVKALQSPLVASLTSEIDVLADVQTAIASTLAAEPPALARDGDVIRDGVDAELDRLRTISRGGKTSIAALEEAERARTGITSLKLRYNRVFGYYIEISKSNLGNVPPDYHRKQTIAGGERFVTPALKEYEEKVLGADERITAREVELFERLRGRVAAEAPRIQDTARGIAALDVLSALAETASIANYTKPQMHAGDELVATEARHPVVERYAPDAFVPNDVTLDAAAHQLVILTGPNMGGKSTFMRQTALIVLLAHVGSYVPAERAVIGPVDRIFTRIG
ncbi:MAG TPA: DNA mismatch repair protein MutS, partial [Vicinamibacterales bacterium]|nr:DNA mismatch repair protein MutS [Vicinamibacterales bacterium]